MPHEATPIVPVLDDDWRDRLTYHCETCHWPVYWDGVFDGKWFHQYRYCVKCQTTHPFEQDGCESWPAIYTSRQTILNLGVGHKVAVAIDPGMPYNGMVVYHYE